LCTTVVKDSEGMRLGSFTMLPGGNLLCVCYMHKCRHLVPATDVPNMDVIKQWLHQGKGITARRHLGMFWEMVRAEETESQRPLAPRDDAVAPPCPPPPPPHPSQAEQVRGRRGSRLVGTFGPFQINELASYDKASGAFTRTGFSIICGRHTDRDGDPNACSSDCKFGVAALDEAEVLRRLKRWALKGYTIDEQQPGSRSKHMRGEGPARRCVDPLTVEERVAIPAAVFTSGELVGL